MQKQMWGIAAAVAAGMVLALGQPTLAKGQDQKGHMGKMAATLGLTDAQKAQMKPVFQSGRDQVKAVKADTSLSPEDRKSKLKAIRKSTLSQISPMLTPDQKLKLAAMRHHHKNALGAAASVKPAF